MAVSLLFKTFITKWQSLRYSKTFITRWQSLRYQNIHHKMAVSLLFITFKNGSFSATWNIHKMTVYLLHKIFITKWQSLCYSKHLSQDGSPSATENIHHKMAVPLLLKKFKIEQSLWYSKPPSLDGSLFAIHDIKKWQSLCYSKHPQDVSISVIKICKRWQSLWNNIQNTAVFLLLKTFITKWQSLCYSKHSSQNGRVSAIQNTHKMAIFLLLKTLTRWGYLCYPEHSCLVFLNACRRRFSIALKFTCANRAKTSQHQVSL